jgi:hypothetical protein
MGREKDETLRHSTNNTTIKQYYVLFPNLTCAFSTILLVSQDNSMKLCFTSESAEYLCPYTRFFKCWYSSECLHVEIWALEDSRIIEKFGYQQNGMCKMIFAELINRKDKAEKENEETLYMQTTQFILPLTVL